MVPFLLAANTTNSSLADEIMCADTAGNSILALNAAAHDRGKVVRRIGHPRSSVFKF